MTDDTVSEVRMRKPKAKKSMRAVKDDLHEEEDVSVNMDETKFLQKMRGRSKGVTSVGTGAQAAAAEAADDAPADEKEGKILGTSFRQEEQITSADQHMQKYIESELAKRRAGGVEPEKPQKPQSEMSRLYETPAAVKELKKGDEEVREAGDRWLTGIAEVQLPISDKIKTIEKTEAAKAALFAKKAAAKHEGNPHQLPVNVSTNFTQHQRDWVENRKSEHKRNADRRDGAGAGSEVDHREGAAAAAAAAQQDGRKRKHEDGVASATDDKVVDRFIKRFKYKK